MMQKRLGAKDQTRLRKLLDKNYRDAFLDAHVEAWLAYQLRALRVASGMTQAELAKRVGTTQSAISRIESEEYGRLSVQTLLKLAKAFDIALLLHFVSYPELLTRTSDKSDQAMQVDSIHKSVWIVEREKQISSALQDPDGVRSASMQASNKRTKAATFQGHFSESSGRGLHERLNDNRASWKARQSNNRGFLQ